MLSHVRAVFAGAAAAAAAAATRAIFFPRARALLSLSSVPLTFSFSSSSSSSSRRRRPRLPYHLSLCPASGPVVVSLAYSSVRAPKKHTQEALTRSSPRLSNSRAMAV